MQVRSIASTVAAGLIALGAASTASAREVPAPFQGHDPNSKFVIQYGDVDTILRTMVVDVGRSNRKVAEPARAQTGTRMKAKVSRTTSTEANRFYFEEFKNNEQFKQALHGVRLSLESIPGRFPLESFNRQEQLAYWLNLYNITVLDELVQIYPERDLKKEMAGKKSIIEQKILNVAGVPLSLNDIQYTILAANYDNDPLIMYGLYQGYIGGPNIRKRAYTGENVYRLLQDNAEEFVNSNRGTYSRDGKFEVSSLYERNEQYFPNFEADLKAHLLRFIEGPERNDLLAANTLRADIDDWDITDVFGTYTQIGGSFTNSQAALLDAVQSQQPGPNGGATDPISANFSVASASVLAKSPNLEEFSPEILDYLATLKQKEEATSLLRQGRVTVEELGTVPVESEDGGGEE